MIVCRPIFKTGRALKRRAVRERGGRLFLEAYHPGGKVLIREIDVATAIKLAAQSW